MGLHDFKIHNIALEFCFFCSNISQLDTNPFLSTTSFTFTIDNNDKIF